MNIIIDLLIVYALMWLYHFWRVKTIKLDIAEQLEYIFETTYDDMSITRFKLEELISRLKNQI